MKTKTKCFDITTYQLRPNRTPYRIGDRVRYINGSDKNRNTQLENLELKVHLIDGQSVTCKKPDGYLTTWLDLKELQPVSV